MPTTITDLWYGNIIPFDKCGAHDSQTSQLAALMERNKEALRSTCTAQQQTLLEKYIACSDDYLLRMMEQAFFSGFSLSAKLLTEAHCICGE